MTTTQSALADYASGTPCEKHELPFCGMCREHAGIRRSSSGEVSFAADCTVATFSEVTGASYGEAVEALAAVGFRPGRGTPHPRIREAFEQAGYTVAEVTRQMTLAEAAETGRSFYVVGQKGAKGHAWSIVDGEERRAYRPPFHYQLFEVTAA